jgi:amino acid adenylation domain-containing protein
MPNTKKYDSELMHLINQWNETEVAYSEDKTVIDLFEAQVDKTPDSVAVIFGEEELTYGELNRRANQVAHYLRSLGVKEETLVGISLNRSLELIVGILGILKAGGAYVPLDPEYPQERLQFMLDDTQAPVLITTREIQESKYTGDWEGQIVLMDDEETCNTLQEQSFHNPIPITTGENLAYVIYTSGSTGHPKGVMATHRAFINRCMWMWERYPFTREEKTCLKTSINFVDAVWEMFGGMLQGITLVVFPQEINKDIEKLLSLIDFYSITRLILVPSLFQAILDYLTQNDRKLISSLKVYTLSGEKLNPDIVLKAQKIINDGLLLNLYGSSEVSADVTYWDCLFSEYTCGESIPIGRPISNTKVYILDEYRKSWTCERVFKSSGVDSGTVYRESVCE